MYILLVLYTRIICYSGENKASFPVLVLKPNGKFPGIENSTDNILSK